MAYTDEQKKRLQTVPANKVFYNTVSFENPSADPLHILISGPNGPYKSKTFSIEGVDTVFIPASCKAPQATDQAEDNSLGTVTFGRVGSNAFAFLDAINESATIPADTVITVTLRQWESGVTDPIFQRVCYADANGITISATGVSADLAFDNPALVSAVPFYDPIEYPGMSYSDQG